MRERRRSGQHRQRLRCSRAGLPHQPGCARRGGHRPVIGWLDCGTGISGDKFLGALLDAGSVCGGFTAEDLRALAATLAPEAVVSVERVRSCGIAAVGVRVEAGDQPPPRTWASVRSQLEAADLPAPVRTRALRAFEELALAEAHVHGVDPDDVHFHEVGALDSIVDVVGVCAGLHALGVEFLVASPVAVGSGTVETSHGRLTVPAPATAALLVDVPIVPGPPGPDGSPAGELTTPTGAALVRACADGFGAAPPMVPRLIGYGAGTRDIGSPNVCRIIIGDPGPAQPALTAEEVVLLETNVDHVSPEALSFAAEQLLAEGALDVWVTPIVMKKGRSAATLSVLAGTRVAQETAARVVALTGTLGVRSTPQPRYVAERAVHEVASPWGPVRVKSGAGRLRPEHDDVARIAAATDRTYDEVARTLTRLAAEQLAQDTQATE
ncbi:MAG: TIGR00299 family protein [Coriobacteriaceae bacterium]|nr:TIGR00299 family protein [Coriobacteriaceae bacterium]